MKLTRLYVDTPVMSGCFDPAFTTWSSIFFNSFRKMGNQGLSGIGKIFIVVAILAAVFVAIPNFKVVPKGDYEHEGYTSKKQCINCMMTLSGACELYCMERNITSEVAVIVPDDLLKAGNLKSMVVCPKMKEQKYTLTVNALQKLFDVECPFHGRLSARDGADKEKGLRKRGYFEKLFMKASSHM